MECPYVLGGIGIGLGLATMFYFLNIIANISDKAKIVKYITLFSYTEAADIFVTHKLDEIFFSFVSKFRYIL